MPGDVGRAGDGAVEGLVAPLGGAEVGGVAVGVGGVDGAGAVGGVGLFRLSARRWRMSWRMVL